MDWMHMARKLRWPQVSASVLCATRTRTRTCIRTCIRIRIPRGGYVPKGDAIDHGSLGEHRKPEAIGDRGVGSIVIAWDEKAPCRECRIESGHNLGAPRTRAMDQVPQDEHFHGLEAPNEVAQSGQVVEGRSIRNGEPPRLEITLFAKMQIRHDD
jgi:hypothetical protein